MPLPFDRNLFVADFEVEAVIPQAVRQLQHAKGGRRNIEKRQDGLCNPLIGERSIPLRIAGEFADVQASIFAFHQASLGAAPQGAYDPLDFDCFRPTSG